MKKSSVSVIIPVYNRISTIEKCLDSVLKNRYPDFEIIVVDDDSRDGTKDILENTTNDRLRILTNEKNRGPSYSRNRGILQSRGEVVLLLDSDTVVAEDWIERHMEVSNKTRADIIGGGIVSIYSSMFGRCDGFCNWWNNVPYSGDYYLKKFNLVTNNMSIRKDVFGKIGYFNEELKTGEDVEFCFRALRRDLKIFYKSDLVAHHYEKNGLREFLAHQKKWGVQAITVRRKMKMDFSFLMPHSYWLAYLYILPLSVLLSSFIICKWIRHHPRVVFYWPVIFLGKISHVIAIKDALKAKDS